MEPLSECLVFAMTLGMTRASSAQLWAAASADRAPFLHSATPYLSPRPQFLSSVQIGQSMAPGQSHSQGLVHSHAWLTGGSLVFRTVGVLSSFSCVQLFATPWTVARQAPLSMGFSRQGYWSGFPCLPPGDFPNLGIELASLTSPALAVSSLSLAPPGKPHLSAPLDT